MFFQPQWLFDAPGIEATKILMSAENASACCILNLSTSSPITFEAADSFFIEANTEAAEYTSRVFASGADAWIVNAGRFVCSSDLGNWVIYCEKAEDVALIAIRDKRLLPIFEPALEELRAASLDDYINRPDNGPFPAIPLVEAWKTEILKNYST